MPRVREVVCGLALLGLVGACAGQETSTATAGSSIAANSSTPASTATPTLTGEGDPGTIVATASVPSSTDSGAAITTPPGTTAPISTPPISTVPVTSVPSTSVKPAPVGQLTLTGVVEEGVEPRCLVLSDQASGRLFNLTGGSSAIVKPGAKVRVVGVIRTDLLSYCQQGAIFQVLRATAG